MRKYTIWDAVISLVAAATICATVVPAVGRLQRTPEDAKCQSNMRRLGEAIQLYTADWEGMYPTNRAKSSTGLIRNISPAVILSKRQFDENGNPVRFVSSINWVEAMFPYLIDNAKKTGRDWESYLACPRASGKWPPSSTTARVSYVFNYSLLEQPNLIIRNSAKLMMLREMDRLVDSYCRPTNDCTGNPSMGPQSTFLTGRDMGLGSTTKVNNRLHVEGSYILFADGHVSFFGIEYFPEVAALKATDSWDHETQQWWNWVNMSPALNKAIAVTP